MQHILQLKLSLAFEPRVSLSKNYDLHLFLLIDVNWMDLLFKDLYHYILDKVLLFCISNNGNKCICTNRSSTFDWVFIDDGKRPLIIQLQYNFHYGIPFRPRKELLWIDEMIIIQLLCLSVILAILFYSNFLKCRARVIK